MSRGPGAKGALRERETNKKEKKMKKRNKGRKEERTKLFKYPDGGHHQIYPHES